MGKKKVTLEEQFPELFPMSEFHALLLGSWTAEMPYDKKAMTFEETGIPAEYRTAFQLGGAMDHCRYWLYTADTSSEQKEGEKDFNETAEVINQHFGTEVAIPAYSPGFGSYRDPETGKLYAIGSPSR